MSRVAFVNGRYLRHANAAVSIDDRAVQFADSVYEVCEVRRGCIVDLRLHLGRLARSLGELAIDWPIGRLALEQVMMEVARRNRVRDGLIYLQISRGAARRDFFVPEPPQPGTIVVTARGIDSSVGDSIAEHGIAVVTHPEIRWGRVDIKTTGLLPNVLAKEAARAAGAREVWFVDDKGFVTEGGSSNAWIVTKDGVLVTRPAESGILRGVTRTVLLKLVAEEGLSFEERGFSVAEAYAAREAFNTAATALVMPVVRIDDQTIGNGQPGLISARLRSRIHTVAEFTDIHARVRTKSTFCL